MSGRIYVRQHVRRHVGGQVRRPPRGKPVVGIIERYAHPNSVRVSAHLEVGGTIFRGPLSLDFSELSDDLAVLIENYIENRLPELHSEGTVKESKVRNLGHYVSVGITALEKANDLAALGATLFKTESLLKIGGLGVPALIKATAVAKVVLLLLLVL